MHQFFAFFEMLSTTTDKELAQQIEVTAQEKQRLLKYGKPLGGAIKNLISIVTPRTFSRWLQGPAPRKSSPKVGRPPTVQETRELILRLARENPSWEYTRILGELKKLNVRNVSRSIVANILCEHGTDPAPRRGAGSWSQFIRRQAQTLWACDFLTKKVWTLLGPVPIFVLFFIHIGSHRVHVAGMTAHPDGNWMAQQARNMLEVFKEQPSPPTILLRDYDRKYTREFDSILSEAGIETKPVGPRAPNLNAFAERWIASIKSECLDHFCCFGEDHLQSIISEYVDHYNQHRPHQGVGNEPLGDGSTQEKNEPSGEIECISRLGGLLNHYQRKAA